MPKKNILALALLFCFATTMSHGVPPFPLYHVCKNYLDNSLNSSECLQNTFTFICANGNDFGSDNNCEGFYVGPMALYPSGCACADGTRLLGCTEDWHCQTYSGPGFCDTNTNQCEAILDMCEENQNPCLPGTWWNFMTASLGCIPCNENSFCVGGSIGCCNDGSTGMPPNSQGPGGACIVNCDQNQYSAAGSSSPGDCKSCPSGYARDCTGVAASGEAGACKSCSACPPSCGGYSSCGTGYESASCTAGNCSSYIAYRCASGYYGNPSSCSSGCSPCPGSHPNSTAGSNSAQTNCSASCANCAATSGATCSRAAATVNYPTSCSYTTGCSAGYYGPANAGAYNPACTRCPDVAAANGWSPNTIIGTSAAGGTVPITNCYISGGTTGISDETGTFTANGNCPYQL